MEFLLLFLSLSLSVFSVSSFGNFKPDLSACPTLESALESSYGVISEIADSDIISICAEADGHEGEDGMLSCQQQLESLPDVMLVQELMAFFEDNCDGDGDGGMDTTPTSTMPPLPPTEPEPEPPTCAADESIISGECCKQTHVGFENALRVCCSSEVPVDNGACPSALPPTEGGVCDVNDCNNCDNDGANTGCTAVGCLWDDTDYENIVRPGPDGLYPFCVDIVDIVDDDDRYNDGPIFLPKPNGFGVNIYNEDGSCFYGMCRNPGRGCTVPDLELGNPYCDETCPHGTPDDDPGCDTCNDDDWMADDDYHEVFQRGDYGTGESCCYEGETLCPDGWCIEDEEGCLGHMGE